MQIAGTKIMDFSSEQSYERIVGDMGDVLVKTSGTPDNWEQMKSFGGVTPGLRDINSPEINKLSMKKIDCLKSHPELIDKISPYGFSCSIMIYPQDPALPTITVINDTNNYASEVYVVNRTVAYSYDSYIVYSKLKMDDYLDTNSSYYKCQQSSLNTNSHNLPDFKKSKPGWVCTEFKVSMEDLNSTDFYLLTDPPILLDKNALWIIDRPDNTTESVNKFTNFPQNIKSRISEVLVNDGVIVLHVYTSGEYDKLFNIYLVGVPSGTPINVVKVNYLGSKQGYFILKIWD